MHGAVVRGTFAFWWMNPLARIGVSFARKCSETQILRFRNCSAHCNGRFNANEMELWMSQLHCVLESRVALVCVFLLCFVTHDCAGLRILIAFCISGLRWSAFSYCVLQLRIALVCVYCYCLLQLRVALVCVFLLCFAIQGSAGLRSLIVLCTSGLRWSACSYCVLQLRVALVCVVLLCFATQGCAGLRVRIVFCNSGVWWFACSNCVLQRTKTKKETHTHTYTHTHTNTKTVKHIHIQTHSTCL